MDQQLLLVEGLKTALNGKLVLKKHFGALHFIQHQQDLADRCNLNCIKLLYSATLIVSWLETVNRNNSSAVLVSLK